MRTPSRPDAVTVGKRRLWPYEELTLRRGSEPFVYVASTPWESARFKATPAGDQAAQTLLTSKDPFSPLLVIHYSVLLQGLAYKPFCYLLPRAGLKGDRPVRSGGASSAPVRGELSWDRESALQLSRIGESDGFDPASLLSVFRRFFQLDYLASDRTSELSVWLDRHRSAPASFASAAALIVAQNLYVTQRCEEVLSAALPAAGAARPKLLEFIAAEKNHDRILGRALDSIVRKAAVETKWTRAVPETVVLMDAFKEAARSNFLAFAFAVLIFELDGPGEQDHFTEILDAAGFHDAAAGLRKHSKINRGGNHEAVAWDLIEFLGPAPKNFAEEALRLAEKMSKLMNGHSNALLERLQLGVGGSAQRAD